MSVLRHWHMSSRHQGFRGRDTVVACSGGASRSRSELVGLKMLRPGRVEREVRLGGAYWLGPF